MLTVRKSDIPEYLQGGELYRTLVENYDDPSEELTFPENVLKLDTSVKSVVDCEYLLGSVRFWGVEDFTSAELAEFALSDENSAVLDVLKKYEFESTFAHCVYLVAAARKTKRMTLAIRSGMVGIVEAADRTSCLIPNNACDLAAEVGSVEILQYFHKRGFLCDKNTSFIAVNHGHIGILKFMCDHGHRVNKADAREAVRTGNLACLQYLHSQDANILSLLTYPCISAAQNGHVDCLMFLHENGCELHANVCREAAARGHLDCLQYAHGHGCPWNYQTTRVAAEGGNLHCLRYLHENGCPWGEHTVLAAVQRGHLDCLRYAHENGCPLPHGLYLSRKSACYAFARQIGILH